MCWRLMTPTRRPRQSSGTDRNASYLSSGSSLKNWKRGSFGEGPDRAILCDPAGDSLPHPDFQFVDLIFVRIFRAPQDQVLAFEHVDKAGIAFHQRDGTFDDLRENFVKRIGGGHAAADGVEQVDFRVAVGTECTVHV